MSDREFISNAAATKRNLPLLDALNRGLTLAQALDAGVPAFAGGGLPGGGAMAQILSREILSGDHGYGYTPQSSDNDRSSAEASRTGRSIVAPPVTIINNSSQPVEAEARMNGDRLEMTLFDHYVDGRIQKAGSSGSLAKAFGKTPPKKRR
ncbi:hypothetical protein [uncultured Brevundimonas sp.]|uniref:hypothetical protein n=1 Tax=uncultured Brevundimonas sp. TaxID=213418 RepID=UPI0025CEC0BD|nr:hypothetical protein [uncultured Brevundimonas sp.]